MRCMRAWLVAAALILSGSGCSLADQIETTLSKAPWFRAPWSDAAATTQSLALEPGLKLVIRPSTLGVTGAVDEVFGNDERVLRVTIREAASEIIVLDWEGTSATGTLALAFYEDAEAMLLPAFWPPGEAEARHNGGLWMTRASFEALERGDAVEWRLGVADRQLAGVTSALKTFHDLSVRFAGAATSTAAASPFQWRKTGMSETFPLLVDGRLVFVRALRVSSWFADLFVLDHHEHPLILKVVVHPAAQSALKAFSGTALRWNELGYEITSVSRP